MNSIFKIKNIRKYLTQSVTEILVLSTVVSHLDYCNSNLAGLPNSEISQMQRVQNIAAKLVLRKSKFQTLQNVCGTALAANQQMDTI